jgi:hypothetical protein
LTQSGHSERRLPGWRIQIGAALGVTHDWMVSARIVSAVTILVILAGGLGPHNVAEAIAVVRPYGVDYSTKTDRANGTGKDLTGVWAFVWKAKGDNSGPACPAAPLWTSATLFARLVRNRDGRASRGFYDSKLDLGGVRRAIAAPLVRITVGYQMRITRGDLSRSERTHDTLSTQSGTLRGLSECTLRPYDIDTISVNRPIYASIVAWCTTGGTQQHTTSLPFVAERCSTSAWRQRRQRRSLWNLFDLYTFTY